MVENTNNVQDSELSFGEIIRTTRSYGIEIMKSWKILLAFIIPFASFFIYRAITATTIYPAKLTFMVNEDEGGLGAMSAASGILGSLGFGSMQEYNLDKILELAKSSRIVNETLLTKEVVNGKNDLVANHLIDIYNLPNTEWKKDTMLNRNFRINNTDINKMSKAELKAIKALYTKIVGNKNKKGIVFTTFTKATSIMTLSAETPNEHFTIALLNTLYDKLGAFYIDKSIEKQKYTYEVIVEKADSLKALLQGKEYRKARLDDSSRGLILEQNKVPAQRLNRDLSMLSIMYSEAVKNAEVADFAMKSKVPFVQSIDIPFAPLTPTRPSILLNTLIGVGIGSLLGIIFIVLRRVIKEALQK